MKNSSVFSKQDSSSLLGRNALMLLLIAPVIGVLWWFSSADERIQPMGRTEERFRADATLVLRGVSAPEPARSCEYWPKHLNLTCTISAVSVVQVHDQLLHAGWQLRNTEEPAKLVKRSYQRTTDNVTLICRNDAADSSCKLSFYVHK
jgi:hypothetical protein